MSPATAACSLTLRARQVWPCIFAFLQRARVTAIWCGVAPFRPPGIGCTPLRGIFASCVFQRESQAPISSEAEAAFEPTMHPAPTK